MHHLVNLLFESISTFNMITILVFLLDDKIENVSISKYSYFFGYPMYIFHCDDLSKQLLKETACIMIVMNDNNINYINPSDFLLLLMCYRAGGVWFHFPFSIIFAKTWTFRFVTTSFSF
jgi:hypothetical protein